MLQKLPKGFIPFYSAKTIALFAAGLVGVFAPIYLYHLFGDSISLVALWFLSGWMLYVILIPLVVRRIEKIGLPIALMISGLIGATYWTLFAVSDYMSVVVFAVLAALVIVLWRLLYWLPYHVEFVKLTQSDHRGSQVSMFWATSSLMTMVAPFVGGFLISAFSYQVVFVIAVVLFIVRSIPYLWVPRANEKFEWGYAETWRNFFSDKYQNVVVSFIAFGAESTIGLIVWPIFIYTLLEGDLLSVGAISSVIVLVSMIGELALGRYIDGHKGTHLLAFSGLLNAVGWIAKMFVVTAFHIFVAGAYHSLVRAFVRTPLDTQVTEFIADQGHYIDEVTVIREMAVSIGKVATLAIIAILALLVSIQWTFIVAALASLFFNAVYGRSTQDTR